MSNPPVATPSNWAYLGCFPDSPSRLLDQARNAQADSIDGCARYCSSDISSSRFYRWFGVESGGDCYCGDALTRNINNTNDSGQCQQACRDNSKQNCGSSGWMQLYSASAGYTPRGYTPIAATATSSVTTGATATLFITVTASADGAATGSGTPPAVIGLAVVCAVLGLALIGCVAGMLLLRKKASRKNEAVYSAAVPHEVEAKQEQTPQPSAAPGFKPELEDTSTAAAKPSGDTTRYS